jgi:hypothetical protein
MINTLMLIITRNLKWSTLHHPLLTDNGEISPITTHKKSWTVMSLLTKMIKNSDKTGLRTLLDMETLSINLTKNLVTKLDKLGNNTEKKLINMPNK